MIRTYSVKYKNKGRMLTTPETVADTEQIILDETGAASVRIEEDGQVVTIEADEDHISEVMNIVVNVFRKIDDKSEVTYKFALNKN